MKLATRLAIIIGACLAHATVASAQCGFIDFRPLAPNTGISLSPLMYSLLTSPDPGINPGLVNAVIGAHDAWNVTNAAGRLGGYTGFVTGSECPAGQPLQIGAFDFTTTTNCATNQAYQRIGGLDPQMTVAYTDYHNNDFFLTNDYCVSNVLISYAPLWEVRHAPTGEPG